jgi:hypothetical protein
MTPSHVNTRRVDPLAGEIPSSDVLEPRAPHARTCEWTADVWSATISVWMSFHVALRSLRADRSVGGPSRRIGVLRPSHEAARHCRRGDDAARPDGEEARPEGDGVACGPRIDARDRGGAEAATVATADPATVRPLLAAAAAENVEQLKASLLEAAGSAVKPVWLTVECSGCGERSRVEAPVPDVRARVAAIELLLREGWEGRRLCGVLARHRTLLLSGR